MSNRAYLTRTKFESGEEGVDDWDVSWGWRIGDDYVRSYDDSFLESEVPTDPLALLAKAAANATPEECALLDALVTAEQGMLINGSWHEFAEIASVLREALREEVTCHG